MVLAKTRTLHSVNGVAAYHGFACAVCSVCGCLHECSLRMIYDMSKHVGAVRVF
jgi:hypothetical protein